MNKGISFKIPNEYGSFLNDILKGINIKEYTWKINEDEVYFNHAEDLFTSEVLEGQKFERLIAFPSYYIVFVKLQAFTNPSNLSLIETYEDFINSDCNILILICDNIFVDIYAKASKDIDTIKKNACNCNFSEIKYITELSDKKILNAI